MPKKGAVNGNASQRIHDGIMDSYNKLISGRIDIDAAKARAGLLRTAVMLASKELEHAKLTGRLAPGDPSLPGYVRTPPVAVPPEVAISRLPRVRGR